MVEPPAPPGRPARRIPRAWLWAPAGAVVVIALLGLPLILAARSDDKSSSPPPPVAPISTGPVTTTPVTAQGPGGSLLVGDRDLYPLLAGNLAQLGRLQVTGNAVPILSILSKEAFWVGKSTRKRLLIHIRTKGLTPPDLKGKKRVNFVGQLSPNRKDVSGIYGVREAADGALLDRQRAHVEVSVADLKAR